MTALGSGIISCTALDKTLGVRPPSPLPPRHLIMKSPSGASLGARSKFWGVSGSEDRGGGDNSIQFINIERVCDKSFKEWRQKIGGWKGR